MKRKQLRFLVPAVFMLGWMVLGMAATAPAAVVIADLENALMCQCDDECGKVLVNCTCDTAKETRADFRKKLESGLTVDQVIQVYVDKYGETVLSAPTKSGFNLTAWLTPFAAIVGGGLGIRKIVRAWLRKNRTPFSPAHKKEGDTPPTAPGRFSKQLQDELEQIEL